MKIARWIRRLFHKETLFEALERRALEYMAYSPISSGPNEILGIPISKPEGPLLKGGGIVLGGHYTLEDCIEIIRDLGGTEVKWPRENQKDC